MQQLSNLWNELVTDPTVQAWLVTKPLTILLILFVALFLNWLLRRIIDRVAVPNTSGRRFLQSIRGDEISEAELRAQERRREARFKTLAAVGKSAVSIIVWSWAAVTILSQLGIDVAPLIASAGVVGVALGFGAQSLVKDFLSGIFMLLEDQYGVGDTIDVGDGISGTVEEVTLRLTTLRDVDGTVWYVRNGEIQRIGNQSDGFSIARIQIPVGLGNSSATVRQVLSESLARAVTDPAVAKSVLDDPEINGMTKVTATHKVWQASIKTLPGQQWAVTRAVQAQAVDDLKEAGVTMPQVITALGGSES